VVGEAQAGEAGGGVGLVAFGVAGLSGGRAVVAQAVGLDHEAKLGPVEVHFEAVDYLFGPWERQSHLPDHREKEAFELLLSEHEGVFVEQEAQRSDSRLARVGIERQAQVVGVDDVELVGLVDRAQQGLRPLLGRQVDHGLDRGGDRDAPEAADLLAG
jgi:hypothetical protein